VVLVENEIPDLATTGEAIIDPGGCLCCQIRYWVEKCQNSADLANQREQDACESGGRQNRHTSMQRENYCEKCKRHRFFVHEFLEIYPRLLAIGEKLNRFSNVCLRPLLTGKFPIIGGPLIDVQLDLFFRKIVWEERISVVTASAQNIQNAALFLH